MDKRLYDFDKMIDRKGTDCLKYDALSMFFGQEDLQPFWVADTDFETPDFILHPIKERLNHPALGYTYRSEEFFQSIIDWQKKRHNWNINKQWISGTPGVVSAISSAILAFTEKTDKVIVQSPVYFPFFQTITGLDRVVANNPLRRDGDRYEMDVDHFEQLAKEGAKMFLLCNPHNPGGMVWDKKTLRRIGEICVQYNIIIVSDEIHSDLILGDQPHLPIANISKEISDITITLMAPSKTFNIAGLATSFVICSNAKVRTSFNKMVNALHIHGGNLLGNIACEAAYKDGEEWLEQLLDYLKENRDTAISYLNKELPKLSVFKPDATYLLWLDFSAYGTEKEIERRLKTDAKVALNLGSTFGEGGKGFFRFNYGCPKSTMMEGLKKMVAAFKD
ncbi:pyridoxal phosphate-dependent aminotransferase [Halosquirtibacter xylanolyticus]|uniref:MalY/PatB family protein n=1 Tax=Halosquirtibacter xylanolyticus TaxID=3374599 RepID=UPI0037490FBC|nr:pyridoxal phosphate-dependent aminotransferase [Prolixibacteraceae bacterium]